jgi:hypothetical protein
MAAGYMTAQTEFVFVDCDEHMELCRNEHVFATPSLRLYSEPGSYEEYFGNRSANSLELFLQDQLQHVLVSKDVPVGVYGSPSEDDEEAESPVETTDAELVLPKAVSSSVVQSNKHDWFYLHSPTHFDNAEGAIEDVVGDTFGDDEYMEMEEGFDDIAAGEVYYDEERAPVVTLYASNSEAPKKKFKSRHNDSSSKDDVTPLDYYEWDTKEERRVSRFAEQLESQDSTSEGVPDLRRRLSRRLTELAPVVEQHMMVKPSLVNDVDPRAFDFRYGAPTVPNMGFTPVGWVEKCLVQNSANNLSSNNLSSGCVRAVHNLQVSLWELEDREESIWWMALVGIYGFMILIFYGLFLLKRVQKKKLVSFHKDRKLRQDVLRAVHGDAELKAKVETALGLEHGLDEETMTADPIASFKKKLGCMGICCLTLPRVAIFVIYMCAVVAMPALIWTVLMPTLCCMSLYGYAMHCCGSLPKDDDEENTAAHLGYPAAVAAQAKTTKEDGSVYEAIPII